jgi:hypothetical protein
VIPNLLDSLIERCQPHVINTRDYLIMFCTGVIERLDAIQDAVQEDDTFSVRREFHGFSTTGPATQTIEVPANETWELESVVARTIPAAASTLDIREQGGRLRFANDIATSGALTGIFSPLTFNGGSILTATMAQPGEFHIVFKHTKTLPDRGAIAGFRNPHTDKLDAYAELDRDNRHAGQFMPHPPIMGPHSRDAQTGIPPQDD